MPPRYTKRSSPYIIHLRDILQLEPEQEPWCAGYAPSKRRRCHLPTNAQGRRRAMALLDEGTEDLHNAWCIDDLLKELASHVLCARHRQSQTSALAVQWKFEVDKYLDCYYHQPPPPPTVRASTRLTLGAAKQKSQRPTDKNQYSGSSQSISYVPISSPNPPNSRPQPFFTNSRSLKDEPCIGSLTREVRHQPSGPSARTRLLELIGPAISQIASPADNPKVSNNRVEATPASASPSNPSTAILRTEQYITIENCERQPRTSENAAAPLKKFADNPEDTQPPLESAMSAYMQSSSDSSIQSLAPSVHTVTPALSPSLFPPAPEVSRRLVEEGCSISLETLPNPLLCLDDSPSGAEAPVKKEEEDTDTHARGPSPEDEDGTEEQESTKATEIPTKPLCRAEYGVVTHDKRYNLNDSVWPACLSTRQSRLIEASSGVISLLYLLIWLLMQEGIFFRFKCVLGLL
ncbi:hypothetical protein BDV12DRAFT_171875 [Aspergillus spectabilis]